MEKICRCRVCHRRIVLVDGRWELDERFPDPVEDFDSKKGEEHTCTTCLNDVLVRNGVRLRKEEKIIL